MATRSVVLIVEDHSDSSAMYAAYLEVSGMDTVITATGSAALQYLTHHTVDAMIVDLGLPDMAGELLAREVRHAANGGKRPAVVVVTGRPEGETPCVYDAFFRKPCDPDALTKTIVRLIADGHS